MILSTAKAVGAADRRYMKALMFTAANQPEICFLGKFLWCTGSDAAGRFEINTNNPARRNISQSRLTLLTRKRNSVHRTDKVL